MSIPLYLIKAEIVGTSLMIWEKSSEKVTAYLKQDYSQLANPPLEKQSILMKQFFKIQKLEARAEFFMVLKTTWQYFMTVFNLLE